ncbi:hypothetical protein ACO0LG_13375 [Undibacterium sp. Ji42W]|uniref:hypothetical protein n=1 Tax=Undibacterium sp. Ji42W TaxID=3413039 RepID=UPI003BF0BFB2
MSTIRLVCALVLITMLSTFCAQSRSALADGNSSSGTYSSSTSIANKKFMDTLHQNVSPGVLQMTAEEVSRLILDLISKIKTAEDFSAKKLENATGLKVYFDPVNSKEYGASVKITDTWFFNITVISGSKDGERSRLLFSFDDQTHGHADMTPICKVDFAAYTKRLNELGFQKKPVYGEHGRLSTWRFSRNEIVIHVDIRGESKEKPHHDCVSMITIDA